MSLPLNGTEGEWTAIDGIPVRLEKGIYPIELDFVKPGMELGMLTFSRE
jgi:beta-glucosidase